MPARSTTNRIRYMALVLSVMMVLGLLFAQLFIALESEHECDGDECPICTCIEICINIINSTKDAIRSSVPVFLFVAFVYVSHYIMFCGIRKQTLVSQKVRMND